MSWVSHASERAAMARVMRRSLHRSVWLALSTWRAVALAWSTDLARLASASAHLGDGGRACRWALGSWMQATALQLQLSRAAVLYSRRGERRALTSWLSYFENCQLVRVAALSWSLQCQLRAVSTWRSAAAERALMVRTLWRAQQRSVWAALSTCLP